MVFLNVGQFVSQGLVWLPVTESLNDSGESATDVFLSPEAQTAHRAAGSGSELPPRSWLGDGGCTFGGKRAFWAGRGGADRSGGVLPPSQDHAFLGAHPATCTFGQRVTSGHSQL